MKPISTFFTLIILLSGILTAQSIGSRLIGIGTHQYSGATYYLADSTKFEWLGNFGGEYDPFGINDYKWTYFERINRNTSTITSAGKTLYIFNANKQVTEKNSLVWDGTLYQNNYRTTLTYDGQGNVARETTQNWVAGSWENSSYRDYTYNAAGKATLTETWYWQVPTSTWLKSQILVEGYNAAGKKTLYETTAWTGTTWVNLDQLINDYDANNNLLTSTQASGSGSTWVNYSRDAYQYDANNNLQIRTYYTWSTATSTWKSIRRELYNYNGANQRTDWTHQTYTTTWDNSYRYFYTYNAAGLRETSIMENWGGGAWTKTFKTTELYNANGGLLESKQQHWDDPVWLDTTRTIYTRNSYNQIELEEKAKYVSGAWEDNGDTRYYYETYSITGLHEPKTTIGMNVYPNPFTVNTVVDIEQPQSGEATIQIYNAQGALVKQVTSYFPAGHNNWLWNGENNTGEPISRGIYFIHVQAIGKLGVQKVVKL